MEFKNGDRVKLNCPWKKKIHGLLGTVSHKNHKLVWVHLDTDKVVALKEEYLLDIDVLDRLADAI